MANRAGYAGRISLPPTSALSSSKSCDAEEKINAFLPVLDDMMESGLVTLEKAQVLQYGRKRSPYLERLKQSLLHRLHMEPTPTPRHNEVMPPGSERTTL